jgi:hypothetical protein
MVQPDDVTEVYSTDDANEAEILRAALHNEGMKCEIDGGGQAGLTGLGMMEIKLLVRAEEYDRARAYIEQHHRGD